MIKTLFKLTELKYDGINSFATLIFTVDINCENAINKELNNLLLGYEIQKQIGRNRLVKHKIEMCQINEELFDILIMI